MINIEFMMPPACIIALFDYDDCFGGSDLIYK